MERFLRVSSASAALLVTAILALTTSPAAAQSTYKKVEITPFGGWYIASDLYSTLGAQIGINNSFLYGARLGIYPNPKFGIEGSYGRASSDLEQRSGSSSFPSSTPLGSLTVNQWDGNLVFTQRKLGSPGTTAFFTIGAGSTDFDLDAETPSGSASGSKSHFAWNIGIGMKREVNEKVAIRLDARYRATDTDLSTSSGVYCDIYGFCYAYSSDTYSSGEISLGLAYQLGK